MQHTRFYCLGNRKGFPFVSAFSSKNASWSTYSAVWSQEVRLGKNANCCAIMSSSGNNINQDLQRQLKKYSGHCRSSHIWKYWVLQIPSKILDMKYFTSTKLTDLLRNIILIIPSAKSGFLHSLNAGCNIKKTQIIKIIWVVMNLGQ